MNILLQVKSELFYRLLPNNHIPSWEKVNRKIPAQESQKNYPLFGKKTDKLFFVGMRPELPVIANQSAFLVWQSPG